MRPFQPPYLFASSLLVLFPLGAFAQTTVTVEPSQDATLIEQAAGNLANGTGPSMFAGRVGGMGGTTVRRAVFAFDTSVVPVGATVTDVSLELVVVKSPNTTSYPFTLHRLDAAWSEGPSTSFGGAGASSQSGDTTWIDRNRPGLAWSQPGGDFQASASATSSIAGADFYTFFSAQMVADVQAWVDDAASNHGWILIGDESTPKSVRSFGSREALPVSRPKLTITFSVACAPAVALPRNAGGNPMAFAALAPSIGQPWTAAVDNNLTGQNTSVLFAFDTPTSVALGGGQTLLAIDTSGSGELLTGAGLTPSQNVAGFDFFSSSVPNDVAFCGRSLSVQAIQFGNPPFVLTNAIDLTIGS